MLPLTPRPESQEGLKPKQKLCHGRRQQIGARIARRVETIADFATTGDTLILDVESQEGKRLLKTCLTRNLPLESYYVSTVERFLLAIRKVAKLTPRGNVEQYVL